MSDASPTLEALDAFIRSRQRGLPFPPWLEERFESDTRRRRSQRLRAAMVPNAIVYNVFLIPDWFLVRDRFWLAVLLHATVVTPWILAVAWLAGERSSRLVRELSTASMPIVIVLQIICTFLLTTSRDAGHYQYFVLLVVLFTNTIQRLPYRFAVVASIIIVCLQTIAIKVSGHMSGAAATVAIMTLAVAAYLTLVSNYYLERDFRRNYLHALRGRLRHVEIDRAARYDALTDLANRRFLNKRLDELWARGDDAASPVAAIMLDIDHFKAFNDRYGHVAGDACLKRVATCITAELRGGDGLAVRYGGEELMALLPKMTWLGRFKSRNGSAVLSRLSAFHTMTTTLMTPSLQVSAWRRGRCRQCPRRRSSRLPTPGSMQRNAADAIVYGRLYCGETTGKSPVP